MPIKEKLLCFSVNLNTRCYFIDKLKKSMLPTLPNLKLIIFLNKAYKFSIYFMLEKLIKLYLDLDVNCAPSNPY